MKENSGQAVARGIRLAKDISAKLKMGDLHGYQQSYDELWDLFDQSQQLPDKDLTALAESLVGVIHDLGEYRTERDDFIQLTGCVNDTRKLSDQFPGSAKITKDFTELLVFLFALKFEFREFDYLDDYVPEVLTLNRRFPNDEDIAEIMGRCMMNLLNLCPYGDIGIRDVTSMMDAFGEMAGRFPSHANINLAYLQALTLLCTVMKYQGRQDILKTYLPKLEETFAEKAKLLEREKASELRTEILRHGLV